MYNSAGSRLRVMRGDDDISPPSTIPVTVSFDVIELQLFTIPSGQCDLQRSVIGSFDSFDMSERRHKLDINMLNIL